MKRALLTLLMFAGPLFGQTVKLPPEVKVQPGRLASVTVEWDGDDVKWASPPDLDVFREYDPDPKKVRLRLIGYVAGKHNLFAVACKAGKLSEFATCSIVVGTPAPPTPPVPPLPPDSITVPSVIGKTYDAASAVIKALGLSVDVVGDVKGLVAQQNPAALAKVSAGDVITLTMSSEPPAPIPVDGFRVLIVFESAAAGTLTPGQQAALYGAAIRSYLNAKCATGTDGKTKEWRIWDHDVDPSAETKLWQEAMKRKPGKDKLPWIIVSNGKSGFEGPLPAKVEDTTALLQKYGG